VNAGGGGEAWRGNGFDGGVPGAGSLGGGAGLVARHLHRGLLEIVGLVERSQGLCEVVHSFGVVVGLRSIGLPGQIGENRRQGRGPLGIGHLTDQRVEDVGGGLHVRAGLLGSAHFVGRSVDPQAELGEQLRLRQGAAHGVLGDLVEPCGVEAERAPHPQRHVEGAHAHRVRRGSEVQGGGDDEFALAHREVFPEGLQVAGLDGLQVETVELSLHPRHEGAVGPMGTHVLSDAPDVGAVCHGATL